MSDRTQQTSDTSRAFAPGSRRVALTGAAIAACLGASACGTPSASRSVAPTSPALSAAQRAQQAAIHRQVTASLHDLKAAHTQYGGIPSYLPKPKVAVGRVVAATPAHHALAIQGDTVKVHARGAQALVTAVGPDVPDRVIGTDAARTTARFDLTLADVRGEFPVGPALFSVIDDLGHIHKLTVTTKAGGQAPGHITAGKPVTLVLSATLPSGDGKLRYRPAGKELVSWDFIVETD